MIFASKTRLILSIFLAIFYSLSYAQNEPLRGRVTIISAFVSNGSSSWTNAEIQNTIDLTDKSLRWINGKSPSNYTLEFKTMKFPVQIGYDIAFSNFQKNTSTRNMNVVKNILAKKGFHGPNVKILVFVKGSGEHYSISCPHVIGSNCTCKFVEGSILYERELNGTPLNPGIIAHEFLHLFGAWDFYECGMQTKHTEQEITKKFPNSIMLNVPSDINMSAIDPITSWLIGWSTGREEYYKYIPIGYIK